MTKAHNQLIADIKELIADGFEEGMSLDDIANNIVIATLGQPQTPQDELVAAALARVDRTIDWAIDIIGMCEPIRCYQGGMWFGHNHNFADATFVDYGAADAFAVAAKALPELVRALEEIEDLGANGATAARLGNIAHAALLSLRVVGSQKVQS